MKRAVITGMLLFAVAVVAGCAKKEGPAKQEVAIDEDHLTIYEKLSGSDHDGNKTKESHANIIVSDVEYASRFAAALKHAIELCGGKPSAF
jgi:hypothetical protein